MLRVKLQPFTAAKVIEKKRKRENETARKINNRTNDKMKDHRLAIIFTTNLNVVQRIMHKFPMKWRYCS